MADKKNNTGVENTGYGNSGYGNSGYGNSGYGNSDDWNSGDRNSGYGNSGYGNSINRESGIFCNEEGTLRIFNKDSGKKWEEIDHPHFAEFYLNKWILKDKMTEVEKKADPQFFVRGGYLKAYEWKEAWANFWRDTDEENRQKILNLPNFSWEVFTDITGIEEKSKKIDLSGKEIKVTLDGKVYTAVIK